MRDSPRGYRAVAGLILALAVALAWAYLNRLPDGPAVVEELPAEGGK